jgi:hypothetical protein
VYDFTEPVVKPKKLEEHSEDKVKRKEEDKKVMCNNYFLNIMRLLASSHVECIWLLYYIISTVTVLVQKSGTAHFALHI